MFSLYFSVLLFFICVCTVLLMSFTLKTPTIFPGNRAKALKNGKREFVKTKSILFLSNKTQEGLTKSPMDLGEFE